MGVENAISLTKL